MLFHFFEVTPLFSFSRVAATRNGGTLAAGRSLSRLLGGGAYWAYSLKPDYHLRISSTGGESTALSSKDKGYVEKLVAAIHEAIIHRG
jgi:hypothetical protein